MKILNIMHLLKSKIYTCKSITHSCDQDILINGVEIFRWDRERNSLISKSYTVAMVFRKFKQSLCM